MMKKGDLHQLLRIDPFLLDSRLSKISGYDVHSNEESIDLVYLC